MGLIHPETHFTDEKAGMLRQETYRRLRRHWQFINELKMFEIHDLVRYGVHVYGSAHGQVAFIQATSIYHPSTVLGSLKHDGSGVEPGLKDENGDWDLRPHASRILHVDKSVLTTWHAILENADVPVGRTRMVYTVNRSTAAVLAKLSSAPRIGSLGLKFSRGWDESIDRKKGFFDSEWGTPESWDQVILQGPHIHVANPFYKSPNPTMKHNQDWTPVDLEALPPDAIPATAYKPRGERARYDAAYTHWDVDGERVASRDCYRLAYRAMAANTGERTLIAALIPPGAAHINGVFSLGGPEQDEHDLTAAAAVASSLIADFAVRAAPKSGIYQSVFERLPFISTQVIQAQLAQRILRLTCLTAAYAPLWEHVGSSPWTVEVGIHSARERRRALVEIDALVALGLGVTADELCAVYRTQFPVLYGYDHDADTFDAAGRLVSKPVRTLWKARGDNAGDYTLDDLMGERPGVPNAVTFTLPFTVVDREADMREAYARFHAQLLARDEGAVG